MVLTSNILTLVECGLATAYPQMVEILNIMYVLIVSTGMTCVSFSAHKERHDCAAIRDHMSILHINTNLV